MNTSTVLSQKSLYFFYSVYRWVSTRDFLGVPRWDRCPYFGFLRVDSFLSVCMDNRSLFINERPWLSLLTLFPLSSPLSPHPSFWHGSKNGRKTNLSQWYLFFSYIYDYLRSVTIPVSFIYDISIIFIWEIFLFKFTY